MMDQRAGVPEGAEIIPEAMRGDPETPTAIVAEIRLVIVPVTRVVIMAETHPVITPGIPRAIVLSV